LGGDKSSQKVIHREKQKKFEIIKIENGINKVTPADYFGQL
jgi:hypothetical protein